jgi:NAD(P)-dependent dehydrogenase (short-subunit alcohol dehydrogenase family)
MMTETLIAASSILFVTIAGFLANKLYFSGTKCRSRKRLDGKVAIITGANTGIGYETALDFARRGARVILACRDLSKASKAADLIISETGNRKVEVEKLDLADLDSVRSFANSMNKNLARLDLLINNAGVMDFAGTKTKQGFDIHFGVNHLGIGFSNHFL